MIAHCVQINLFVSHENWTAKLFIAHNGMRHSFHLNFLINSLVHSNPVLFASGNCDLSDVPLQFIEFFNDFGKNPGKT